jgi:hypothetical protein
VVSKCDPENRRRTVRLVLEYRNASASEWTAISAVSNRLGDNRGDAAQLLWVRNAVRRPSYRQPGTWCGSTQLHRQREGEQERVRHYVGVVVADLDRAGRVGWIGQVFLPLGPSSASPPAARTSARTRELYFAANRWAIMLPSECPTTTVLATSRRFRSSAGSSAQPSIE